MVDKFITIPFSAVSSRLSAKTNPLFLRADSRELRA